jgi:hypothetical protein
LRRKVFHDSDDLRGLRAVYRDDLAERRTRGSKTEAPHRRCIDDHRIHFRVLRVAGARVHSPLAGEQPPGNGPDPVELEKADIHDLICIRRDEARSHGARGAHGDESQRRAGRAGSGQHARHRAEQFGRIR